MQRGSSFREKACCSKSAFDGRELNNKNYERKRTLHVPLRRAEVAKLQRQSSRRIIEDKLRYIIKIATICTDANGLAIISVNYLKNNAALEARFWGSM